MTKPVFGKSAPGASGPGMTLVVCLALWTVVLAGLSGCVVEVVPQDTPAPGPPGIVLDPVAGPVGTPLTVRGAGWSPGASISIYLVTEDQVDLPPTGTASLAADAAGNFETQLLIPTGSEWESAGLALVVARETESDASAEALFNVTSPPEAPSATVTPAASPTVAQAADTISTPPAPGVPVGVATTQLNVRAGPGADYPILGGLQAGQSVEITGFSPDEGGWWQIRFAGAPDGLGWVSARYVVGQNIENVPVVGPSPSPPTPVPTTGWRGEYYNNRNLSGDPVLVRDDAAIDFDWGAGAPAAGLPADNFSVRWSRDVSLEAGTYRFFTNVDDGIRLWVDGALVIDEWRDGLTSHAAELTLSDGVHNLRVEYYEHEGNALAQLAWERPASYPDWKGEYFNNVSLAGLPVLVRNDPGISFDWGPDSPGPGVPADEFSARWTREEDFDAGTYNFRVVVDDGARLYVNDELVIDAWRTGAPKGFSGEIELDEGTHRLRLEYFDARYDAQVHLSWERVGD